MLVYAYESAKWMIKGFPPVTKMIEGITQGGEKVLHCLYPCKKKRAAVHEQVDDNVPVMTKHPIDFVIQNIPHIW
jgi:hypothetical protein